MARAKGKGSKMINFTTSKDENFEYIEMFLSLQSNKSFSLTTLILNEINRSGMVDIATLYPAKTVLKKEKKVLQVEKETEELEEILENTNQVQEIDTEVQVQEIDTEVQVQEIDAEIPECYR